jgi:hypothetical protein
VRMKTLCLQGDVNHDTSRLGLMSHSSNAGRAVVYDWLWLNMDVYTLCPNQILIQCHASTQLMMMSVIAPMGIHQVSTRATRPRLSTFPKLQSP